MLFLITLIALIVSVVLFVEYMVKFVDYENARYIKMEEGNIDDVEDRVLIKALSQQFNDDMKNINDTIINVKTHVLNSFRHRYTRRNALAILAEELE